MYCGLLIFICFWHIDKLNGRIENGKPGEYSYNFIISYLLVIHLYTFVISMANSCTRSHVILAATIAGCYQ